jgi:hypothetical protein
VQTHQQIKGFPALRESQKRYVFSGENVIEGDLGGEISSVAANHSLTLQNAVFGAGYPAVCPGGRNQRAANTAKNHALIGRV